MSALTPTTRFNPKTGEPNEVVRVVDGPLAGREGYIARFRRDKRLVFNMKVPGRDAHLAVAIPRIWDFHVVRLHNAEGDRLSIGTEKGRAADLLIGMLQACGYRGRTPAMLAGIVGRLAAKPSLAALAAQLRSGGHGELARRLASIGPADASLLMNLVRYEAACPGYVAASWARATLRPFLTPTAGVETGEGFTEAELPHEGFTELVRRVDITEDVYYPTTGKDATITTTYYAHIGIMPPPCSEAQGPQSPLPTGRAGEGLSSLQTGTASSASISSRRARQTRSSSAAARRRQPTARSSSTRSATTPPPVQGADRRRLAGEGRAGPQGRRRGNQRHGHRVRRPRAGQGRTRKHLREHMPRGEHHHPPGHMAPLPAHRVAAPMKYHP